MKRELQMGTDIVPSGGNGAGIVAREEFGARQLERRAETAVAAVAAQAKAMVEARYIMALQRPRSWQTVRLRLVEECSRPGFAALARYAKPVGKKKNEKTGKWEQQFARGWSAAFARSASRIMGNLLIERATLFDDDRKRIIRVFVTDLESNHNEYDDVAIVKTVERRNPKEGTTILGERLNSYGERIYIVEATDDEVKVKAAAELSKMRRNLVVNLLPDDIKEDCLDVVLATNANPDAVDPTKARKKLFDGFFLLNVLPADLGQYLGHDPEKCTPAEMDDLRNIWVALNEGDTTWAAVMQDKQDAEEEQKSEDKHSAEAKPASEKQAPSAPPRTTAEAKAREKAKRKVTVTVRDTDGKDITPKPEDDGEPPPPDHVGVEFKNGDVDE